MTGQTISLRSAVCHGLILAVGLVSAAVLPLLAQEAAPPQYPAKANLLVYREAAGKEQPIRTAADWQVRRKHIVENMQRVMGPLPDISKKVPLDIQVAEEFKAPKYIRKLLTYAADKSDRVSAYLFIPTNLKSKVPAVLCLHPTERTLGKKVVAGLGGLPHRQYAVELAERGYVTIAPDYVNMGGYKYDPYKNGWDSATMKGIWNHMRAVDLLQSLPEVDGAHIGAVGHSLGGHNSMFVGVFDERIRCVVSCCGFCSFPTYYKGNIAGWSHDGYMPKLRTVYGLDPKKVPFDFPEVVAALAPRAFLAVAPVNDSNFDMQGVKDCITAARPIYRLLQADARLAAIYPNCAHDFPDEARRTAYAWLDRWLQK
jgi:hypothetical protein